MMSGVGDFIDRAIEYFFVSLRGFGETAQLPDELQRRRPNLITGRWRTEIMQGFNGSAHEAN
jgi:hypothetical protein